MRKQRMSTSAEIRTPEYCEESWDRLHARISEAAESLDAVRRGETLDEQVLQAANLGLREALQLVHTLRVRNYRLVDSIHLGEEKYRSLVDNLEDVVFSLDPEGIIEFISPAVNDYGYSPSELVGTSFAGVVHPEDLPALRDSFASTLSGVREPHEFRVRDRWGKLRCVRSLSRAVSEGGKVLGISGVLIDVTEQRMAEQQLRLAQKMEAMGRLAGGIAHDFNNITSVILTYSGFLLEALEPDHPARADAQEISDAADRAAKLTSYLLAFGRKQVLQPAIVDINALVTSFSAMIQRVIGKHIKVVVRLAPDLGHSKVDSGQLEQVLLNVAVNSRDAMPEGGHLTIETSNVELDDRQAHGEVRPGPYVLLAISDDGCGMDEATAARAFDPFFTTKELGKGTGLGLPTVYGIIRQSGGMVRLSSRPGEGTSLKLYLPRHLAD